VQQIQWITFNLHTSVGVLAAHVLKYNLRIYTEQYQATADIGKFLYKYRSYSKEKHFIPPFKITVAIICTTK